MFANTQMLGADLWPDAVLDSKPAPAAVPAVTSPTSTSWMDAVLQPGPAHGSSWVDAVLPPGPQSHGQPAAGGGMGGFGGMLGALSSFLPQIAPAVAGGIMPGAPRPSGSAHGS